MVLLPLLALLAGAGIAVALLLALADDSPGAPAEAAEQRDSGSIVLDADQYIGRPVDEVVRRLTRLGLDVEPRGEPRADVVPDQVTAVEPAGRTLTAGDTVVVTYATPVADGGSPSGTAPAVTGAAGDAGTPVEEPVEVDQAAPESTRAPAPTPTLAGSPTSAPPTTSGTPTQSTTTTATSSPPSTTPTTPTSPSTDTTG
jgi:serine/threonine-protein kinase